MKITIKGYYEPTPVILRKIGDSLLAVSTFITAYGIANEIKWLSYTSLAIGVVGKFLSNFFTDEKNSG